MTAGFGKSDQGFHPIDVDGSENFRAERILAPAGFGKWPALAILTREQPVREREVRQKSNTGARAFRQDLGFGVALQQTIVVLHAREISRAGRRAGCAHLFGGKIRASDFAHFSGLYRVIQHLQRVGDRRARVRTMNLIQVDGVDLKSPQTGFESRAHIFWTGALPSFAHFHSEFRGDDRLLPAALERLSEKLFALAAAVNIGRIEKVDPRVERGIEHGRGSRGIRPPTEVVASQANKTHVKRSKLAIFHSLYITIGHGQAGPRPSGATCYITFGKFMRRLGR